MTSAMASPPRSAPSGRRRGRAHRHDDGRIGPNAIIQTYDELVATVGEARATALLLEGTGRLPTALPDAMVDEGEVNAFARTVLASLGPLAHTVMRHSGHRTAKYLLANRIPRPAQFLIRALPERGGLALLFSAISRHAWTFAGTGNFSYELGDSPSVTISHCPMCRSVHSAVPACDFYAGTFEGLLRALIDPRATVHETACESLGDPHCRFALDLPARLRVRDGSWDSVFEPPLYA
jgi:divinyl protochlorophyllide a 8-vinyl-reductase